MPRILYIEDTENNRILVKRRLEKNGYQVLTAEKCGAKASPWRALKCGAHPDGHGNAGVPMVGAPPAR